MNPKRWKEVQEFFHQALELPAEEVSGFLDRSCAGDTELRREVEDLLRSDVPAADFLADPLIGERAGGLDVTEDFLRQLEESPDVPSDPGQRFAPGTLLDGRYRIVHLLGRGGMGEVYRAEDLKLEQEVALKFLPESAEGDEAKRARLLKEVKIARQITHPNVCRVFDVGEMDSHLFLSMEFIKGEDLASLLRRIGRLTPEKALEFARQLAEGLAAAHERSVLHCDLKPANLMIDGDGRLRIADFGIARAAGSTSSSHGTPAYMAPEQFATRRASTEADVYALGLVLYELFTGRRAFEADSRDEIMRQHLEISLTPPSRHVPMDPEVEKLILSCLEQDPGGRPSSAAEVVRALPVRIDAPESLVRRALMVSDLTLDRREPLVEDHVRHFESLHQRILKKLLKEYRGVEIDRTDETFQWIFDRPVQAVRFALAYHHALANLPENESFVLGARIGIHLCQSGAEGSARAQESIPPPTVMDLDTAERLASLAEEGQTLMTRAAFDQARQSASTGFHGVRWLAHGSYEMEGAVESLGIYEVGEEGFAPLRPPVDSPGGRRRMVQETISGWRPAPGQGLPRRPHWTVEKKLSEGGFGEVWLAVHRKTGERRVFKFCHDPVRLHSLQREITLFRLLKETLGDRDDITRVLDWNFDEAPYFIESEYTAGGSLVEWAERKGGLVRVPLATRLDLVARVATALSAAHSVGVLHKDVKPANVLVTESGEGVRARLSDFGVGLVTEHQRLVDAGITAMGITELQDEETSSGGTRLYMAPELLEGKPATLQADIYALGVVLYQMVVGDFSRALGPGWRRDIDDDLLREDIAVAVDGSPERRLSSASALAERLGTLERRREERTARELEEKESRRLRSRLRWVAWSTAGLAFFTAFVTLSLYFVQQEADRANREAEAVEALSELLVDVLGSSDPYQPSIDKGTAMEVLERGATEIQSGLQVQPRIRAKVMNKVGTIYKKLGHYDQAIEFLGGALEIRRGLDSESVAVVESLYGLAEVVAESGDYERAEALSREAIEIRSNLGDDQVPCLEDVKVLLARVLFEEGRLDEAEQTFRGTLALYGASSEECWTTAASSHHGLAAVLNAKEDFGGAVEIYRDLLREQETTLGRRHVDVAQTLNALALTLKFQESFDEAEGLYEEALEIRREALGDSHPETSLTANNLGHLLREQGKYSEAEGVFNDSLSRLEAELGERHRLVAFAKLSLAMLYRSMGDLGQAREWLDASLAIYDEVLGEDHPEVLEIRAGMKDFLES